MLNGWRAKRRTRQAEAIRRWRPWEQSTGLRTTHGKAKSARNAYRGAQRQRFRELAKALSAGLGMQREGLRDLDSAQGLYGTAAEQALEG